MLIDSHAHLTDPLVSKDIKKILTDSHAQNVAKVITIGTSTSDSLAAVALAKKYSEVYASVGVYPDEMPDTITTKIKQDLQSLSKESKVVGIGETGIDIPKDRNPFDLTRQIELFKIHLAIAEETHLPVIIHNRNADNLILETLKEFKSAFGVFHCFTSDWEFAKKILDLNFYISFSGIITYPSAASIIETVEKVPEDRVLVETDAPFLTPYPYRGQINNPSYLYLTILRLAELKKITPEKAEEITYNNTVNLFSLPRQ